jgi:hypothetical protein
MRQSRRSFALDRLLRETVLADPHVIELGLDGPQACLDVAQALPVGELREGHHAEVIGTPELLDLVVAAVPADALIEVMPRHVLHQLREYGRSRVHSGLPLCWDARYYASFQVADNPAQL